MNEQQKKQWAEQVTNCTASLYAAIQQAGGDCRGRFMDMTLQDFIANVAAQNHIRFVFQQPIKSLSEPENEG